MSRIRLFHLICAACIIAAASRCLFPNHGALISIRGGKKSKPVLKNIDPRSSRSRKRKHVKEEEDDEEEEEEIQDDDEEEEDVYIPTKTANIKGKDRRKQSGQKSLSKNRLLELIPWGKVEPGKKGLGIRQKLEDLAKQSQSAYKDIYRRAKVFRSSPFEGVLLKATWPGDAPVPKAILDEIIKHFIPAFKYKRSSDDSDSPYHTTMHKLWTKMSERDWRTVIKSLFILHVISRDSSVDACEKFSSAMRSMARLRNPKKADQKYFDIRQVINLDVNGKVFKSFIQAYATHVFYRVKTFSGRFEELKGISESTTEKQAVAYLKKARTLIENGLKCTADTKGLQNAITAGAVRRVALDLSEIWTLFSSKIAPLVVSASNPADVFTSVDSDGSSSGSDSASNLAYGGAKATAADVLELVRFFQVAEIRINEYLSKASKAFAKVRGVKIPSVLEPSTAEGLTADKVSSRIESLMKISGGASDDDDDDDEDDDEQDGEGDEETDEDNDDDEEDEEDDDEVDDIDDTDESEDDDDDEDQEAEDEDSDENDDGEEEIQDEDDD